VVVTMPPGVAEAVCRTQTLQPGLIVPGAFVKLATPQPIEYSPLTTEMGEAKS